MTVDEDFGLRDKVAIITGAGKGIGEAIAATFADAGADVVLCSRTESDLANVADQIEKRGRRALVAPGDVNDLEFLASLVDRTVADLGGVDILVNNAGGSLSRPFLETSVRSLEKSFHFNISSPFELCKLVTPHMLSRGGGSIVNIGSVAGIHATRGSFTHSLMKASVAQMTRLLAAELSPRIRVNAVLPGAVETDSLRMWLDMQPASAREGMAERTAMRRNGIPADIAPAVLYFASPAASWVTGKLLEVDGSASSDLVPLRLPDL